ncbi:MAG: Tat pathway signal sequence domain protein [Opitutaceae bacterium]|jgi:hypothetical protein|nr:Tat pathway signal sequence domain protein [Opitutaceae bacterium]
MNSPLLRLRLPALSLLLALPGTIMTTTHAQEVALRWLDETPPAQNTGVSFGVPWPQGAVGRDAAFTLNADGQTLPVQTWPLAYWPDGSLKWSGIATVVPSGFCVEAKLAVAKSPPTSPTPSPAAAGALRVTREGRAIVIDTGALVCAIPGEGGENLIDSLRIGDREAARAGRLVCLLQNGPAPEPDDTAAPGRESFASIVKSAAVEQSGPVRAVVRLEGFHRGARSGREWLPFTVRLYFYSGQTAVRMVHTIVFDGDQEKDFVRGLGVRFDVPMREQVQNRTVRFAGENGGVWSEPLQPGGGSIEQETGKPFAITGEFFENAVWDDFKLVQPNPRGFNIVKRTNRWSTWIASAAGARAGGYVFAGDLGGGLGVGIKDFWQSYPVSLEVRRASTAAAQLTAWLWSPDAQEMDMRHYDIRGHTLRASYEDVQPGMSTAYGVARTSELMLFPSAALPSRAAAAADARAGAALPLLVSTPEYMHSAKVFGVWSLPDRSTAFKRQVEDGLDSVLAFYQRQVDERDWYGFWQYGDFMHSYSAPRHLWHYDWGGHAWQNTELGVPLWLWYSFLRTGRADLFRLAEANTRNTSETNVYHLGPMAGLGSRHNVVKWGCGAKEARVSQAVHWRAFYYLTADERTGDIMRMATKADESVARYDPMRLAQPQVPGEPEFASRIRIGPDWFVLAGNWMTEWERTGDTRWLDRILAGVDSIMAMPYWIQTGQRNGLNPDILTGKIGPLKGGGSMTVGYDIATGKLTPIRDPITKEPVPVSYNLATIQGGAEVMFELVTLLGREDFARAWLQYCRIGGAPADVLKRDQKTGAEGMDARYVLREQSGPRMAAYAYAHTKSAPFAERAIADWSRMSTRRAAPKWINGADSLKPVEESLGVSTNSAAQTGLTTIQILELCKDHLPTDPVPFPDPAVRRRR